MGVDGPAIYYLLSRGRRVKHPFPRELGAESPSRSNLSKIPGGGYAGNSAPPRDWSKRKRLAIIGLVPPWSPATLPCRRPSEYLVSAPTPLTVPSSRESFGLGQVAGVLLAAGRSRRMGRPKQLLPIDGITMIEAVITRVRPHVDHLVVVIGHAAEEVAPLLRPHGVRVAVNEEVDRGMLGSVKCGLRAAGTRCRGYLFCLGDQPGLTDSVVQAVLTAAASSEKGIVIPSYSGRRGHPVYLSRRYYHEILGLDERSGLNALTGSRPSDTLEVPVADPAVLEDVDTPADYARMLDAGAS